jgi:hypothetical protein
MVKIANDIPKFIMDILGKIDYSKLTDAHYDAWIKLVEDNIGKHLRLKRKPCILVNCIYPIRQDFCDIINAYDFNSLPLKKQLMVIPLATKWANENLPLIN